MFYLHHQHRYHDYVTAKRQIIVYIYIYVYACHTCVCLYFVFQCSKNLCTRAMVMLMLMMWATKIWEMMCRLLASLRLFVNDLELTLSLFFAFSLSLPPSLSVVFVTSVMCRCTFMRFVVPCLRCHQFFTIATGWGACIYDWSQAYQFCVWKFYVRHTMYIHILIAWLLIWSVNERMVFFLCVRINFIIIHFLLFGILNFERTLVWLKTEIQNDFSFKLLINLTHLKFFYFDTITSAIK